MKGKRATILIGMASLGLLGTAAWFWSDDILISWHLAKLRNDPGYLHAIADALPGSPQGRALRKFALAPEGKQRLISTYLDHLRKTWTVERSLKAIEADPNVKSLGFWVDRSGAQICQVESNPKRIIWVDPLPVMAGFKWSDLQDLMVETNCRDVELPGFTGLRVGVMPSAEAKSTGVGFLDTEYLIALTRADWR